MTKSTYGVGQDEHSKPENSQEENVKEGGVVIILQNLYFQLLLNAAIHIELYDPEQSDEQEVKGDEEAEGPPHV